MAADALYAVQPLVEKEAASVVLRCHFPDTVLAALQRRDPGLLGNGVDRGDHLALDHIDRLHDLLVRRQVAKPPPCHGIGLGKAVDEHCPPSGVTGQGAYAHVRPALIHHALVDLIRQDIKIMLLCEKSQLLQTLLAVHSPGGIVGRVDDHRLCPSRDCPLDMCKVKAEILRRPHSHRHATGHAHHLRVADPAGAGDDDLVPRITEGEESRIDTLLGSRAQGDLIRCVLHMVFPHELGRNGLSYLRHTHDRRVPCKSFLNGLLRRPADMGRGIKIGLTYIEPDHRDALPPHCSYAVGQLHRPGRLHFLYPLRNHRSFLSLII